MKITEEELKGAQPFEETQARVERVLASLGDDLALWVQFVARYTAFNGSFGSAVAQLAGTIGSARSIFVDPSESLLAVSDRSVLVGSFFFDAARDEFDDTKNPARDTHRCLAQAFLKGLIGVAREKNEAFMVAYSKDEALTDLLDTPIWLDVLCNKVRQGYGANAQLTRPHLFRAMGYHLGSEVLADQEFSLIDAHLRKHHEDIVNILDTTEVEIGGTKHNTYHWLKSHSGHGDAVEFDHFQWAVEGVEKAFEYTPSFEHEAMRDQVIAGFIDFAGDHAEFFGRV